MIKIHFLEITLKSRVMFCTKIFCIIQPDFSRLPRFFYSAKILDGDWSISGISVCDWFIFAE